MTYKDPNYHKKEYLKNKDKRLARQRERRTEIRNLTLLRIYGISLIEWETLFNTQKGCCAICGIHQGKLTRSLDTDHCHTTGKVRGLLCGRCNTHLGTYENRKKEFENYLRS